MDNCKSSDTMAIQALDELINSLAHVSNSLAALLAQNSQLEEEAAEYMPPAIAQGLYNTIRDILRNAEGHYARCSTRGE